MKNKPTSSDTQKPEATCEHNWAIKVHKERSYLSNGDYYPEKTTYFCTKCLEEKTKVES